MRVRRVRSNGGAAAHLAHQSVVGSTEQRDILERAHPKAQPVVEPDGVGVRFADVQKRKRAAGLDLGGYRDDECSRVPLTARSGFGAHAADLDGRRESKSLTGHRHQTTIVVDAEEVPEFGRALTPRSGFGGLRYFIHRRPVGPAKKSNPIRDSGGRVITEWMVQHELADLELAFQGPALGMDWASREKGVPSGADDRAHLRPRSRIGIVADRTPHRVLRPVPSGELATLGYVGVRSRECVPHRIVEWFHGSGVSHLTVAGERPIS